MKRKVSRILSLLMTLVLMGSFNPLYVSAQEYEAEGDLAIGGTEIGVPESNNILFDKEITVGEFNVEFNKNIIQLNADEIWAVDADNGIQTFAAGDEGSSESTLRCGTVSDYLSETDDYRLYGFNLTAGDYLQARLSVPNNAGVNYCIPIFDSEFNLLKRSTYPAYSNDMLSSEQSVGYLCTSDEEIIFGAYSLGGGSATAPFTLEFSVTTNFSGDNEPNEHALEAVALPYGVSGTTVSGRLNSPVDDDWYSFTVPSDPRYERTRLSLTSTSSLNVCKMEVYKIDSGMTRYGCDISEMEMKLSAGTYYVRVSSVNAVSDFYPADIPDYSLSIVPVGRVEGIWVKHYTGYDISDGKTYFNSAQEPGYVIKDNPSNNYIAITAMAYYNSNPKGTLIAAPNVNLIGTVENKSTGEVTATMAVSGQDGSFTIKINFGDAVVDPYNICYYEHEYYYYNYMTVKIYPYYDNTLAQVEHFYLLKKAQ